MRESKTVAAAKTAETTPAEVKSAETKAEAKKKTVEKKTTGRKAAAKKPAAKRTTAKKTVVTEKVCVQFDGKSYTTEALVKIAKDVWKYDLKKKVGDFKSVELFVKPEESMVYYVINDEIMGSFAI